MAQSVGAQDGSSGFRAPDRSDAVARIAAVTGELAAAESLNEIVTVVAEHVCLAARAAVSTLMLREGDRLVIAGSHGVAPEKAGRWASFPISDDNPASEAVRLARPIVAATAEEVRQRYPGMAPDTPVDRSVVGLPLRTGSEVLGAIGLTFERNWRPGAAELDFLMTFADACAQAVRRVRATDAARRSASQLEFLARASLTLSTSLDYYRTLASVARLAVPTLADWCAVDVLAEDGDLRALAVAHVDEAKVEWAWQLRENYPIDMSASTGPPNVVRTGVSELTPEVTDDMIVAAARDEEHLRLCRELAMSSVLIVPLLARGRPLGAITLIRSDPSPAFTDSDVTVAEDLGRRAGIAVDNARLHEHTVGIAHRLQTALLPDELGGLPGWHTEAYYRPVGSTEVGGDFYDAVRLADGRLAMFIGDVMGHGITAAAAMAQIRAAVRALLTVDPQPNVVLNRLDTMFETLPVGALVSIVYVLVDRTGTAQIVNAGHCPPILVQPQGATLLPHATRPPLGAGQPPLSESGVTTVTVPPGCALLLYTDGAVERRGEPIDDGLGRLLELSSVLLAKEQDGNALAEVINKATGPDIEDDVASICLRRLAE